MLTSRKLKGAACAAVVAATAFIVSPPADAAARALPVTDHVFILPGASPDAWAPRILDRIDPWSTDNPRVRKIDANYYCCPSPCNLGVIAIREPPDRCSDRTRPTPTNRSRPAST